LCPLGLSGMVAVPYAVNSKLGQINDPDKDLNDSD
jgi:hypothetical protein